jgi:hypothetical protein
MRAPDKIGVDTAALDYRRRTASSMEPVGHGCVKVKSPCSGAAITESGNGGGKGEVGSCVP